MQAEYSRQMLERQQMHRKETGLEDTENRKEVSLLEMKISKVPSWFPYFHEVLRRENLCRLVEFSDE